MESSSSTCCSYNGQQLVRGGNDLTHTSDTGFSGLHQKLNTEVSHLPKMVVSSASIPAIEKDCSKHRDRLPGAFTTKSLC